MKIKKINCYIFREKVKNGDVTVIFENGSIASADFNDEYYVLGFYSEPINAKTSINTLWEDMSESDLYEYDCDGQDEYKLKKIVDDEVIKYITDYHKENGVEFIIHETGQNINKLKPKEFNEFKKKLNFDLQ